MRDALNAKIKGRESFQPIGLSILREAVARLDAASLERRRNITVPFATDVLADLLASDEISGTVSPPSRDGPALL